MVLGLGLRLTNTALQARRDAQRREAQRLNKGVKTGQVRLERRTGMAYGSHCKKGGAGGSGTWGALNRYDDMDDDWEEVEQDDDEVVEKKAPAFASTWLKDFQAVQDLKIPGPPAATPPNTQKLLEALIRELTLAIPYAPKKLKKEMVYKGKNNRKTSANLRNPRVQNRNGVRNGSEQPMPGCRCH